MADVDRIGTPELGQASMDDVPAKAAPIASSRQFSTFGAFQIRSYRWLFGSTVSGTLGFQMQSIALGWLVYLMTGSAVALGAITSTQAICQTSVSPLAGVLADRVERRTFIMLVRSLTVIVALYLAIRVLTNQITYFELLVAAAIFGIAFGLNGPARQALIAQLVTADLLLNAVSLISAGMNLTRIVGPALAGVMIGVIGVGGIYVVLVILYSAVIIQLVPVPPQPIQNQGPQRNVFVDLLDGFSYSVRMPAVFGLLLLGSVPLFFAMPYAPLLPIFAEQIWHSGATGYGALAAAPGIGGLIGALVVASMGQYKYKGRLMLIALVVFGAALSAFALAPSFLVAEIALLVVGGASVTYTALVSSLLQLSIPNEMRGRVMAFYQMSFGISGLSALPASAVAASIGAPSTIAICGILTAVAGVVIFAFRPTLLSL